jgi:3'-5' exoribonuclease
MKSIFIADLRPEQPVQEMFLVRARETRSSSKSNASWLQLVLVDRSGSIDAKMWDNFDAAARIAEPQRVIRIHGRTKLYQNRLEMTVERVTPVADSDFTLADFVAHTRENVDDLFARLSAEIHGIANPWLRKLGESVLNDPEIAQKLKCAPAAMTMHHAYVGGLLEHIVSLCGLARATAKHYPEVDHDLLLTGVLLHDIGKIEELTGDCAINYSDDGRLLGHITMGVVLTQRKIAAIPDFPPRLMSLVEHMILSHHGSLEFGAPVLPSFREAVLLHYLDDMDSKMASIRGSLEAPADGHWTGRNPALRREMLRTADFLETKPKASPSASSVGGSDSTFKLSPSSSSGSGPSARKGS